LDKIPSNYLSLKEGWYLFEETFEKILIEEIIPLEYVLYPPFFYSLLRTRDWEEFENYTFWLLKIIGINNIYKFEKQKGRADGFFIFRNLAVIYDCTLDIKFEETKNQQIENYCAQLKSGRLEYEKVSYDINQCQKQVWIITKGTSKIIKQIDDIVVKEVSIQDLIKIYRKRMNENINEKELEELLVNI
jgi:hypothetical protein